MKGVGKMWLYLENGERTTYVFINHW